MKITIDIPEELIIYCINRNMPVDCEMFARKIIEDIANGTPLPKGHGRLIDADALIKSIEKKSERLKNLDTINGLCGAINLIYDAPTIIEADKEVNE